MPEDACAVSELGTAEEAWNSSLDACNAALEESHGPYAATWSVEDDVVYAALDAWASSLEAWMPEDAWISLEAWISSLEAWISEDAWASSLDVWMPEERAITLLLSQGV